MAAASCLLSEDQFLCPICMDVFTNPVTIPCGHNFCKNCVTTHFDITTPWKCPLCQEVFLQRPELRVNTFISEMVVQFREEAQQMMSSSSEQQAAKPGDVLCNFCTGTNRKALKSCLVCLASYCETHLEHHLTVSALKTHPLINPTENLEDKICTEHKKPYEFFCKTDKACVCILCTYSDHKTHEIIPLTEKYEENNVQLGTEEAKIQQMIKERQLKVQEIQHSVELSKDSAQRNITKSVEVFTALTESVQRNLDKVIEDIEDKQTTTEKQAEDFIKELKREISELEKRSTEVELLSHAVTDLHLFHSLPFLKDTSPLKDWTEISLQPPTYEISVVTTAIQLQEELSQEISALAKAELEIVQQFAVDVTLDPDTAHPHITLSDDEKQAMPSDVKKALQDNPERFSVNPCVLGKQSFSSGRFYFEVQVKGKTEWDLGVVRESIDRKADVPLSPEDGYWTIWLRKRNRFRALDETPVNLPLKCRPQKVGVFVDYEEGLVSFYDVGSSALIYSFIGCRFNDKLLPYFNPGLSDGGKNAAPLIITSVRHNM
ncbi:E3 ubiquitin-protein ligase TRIM39-like [Sphaeramia orbicularis]|uniref:E3 ubiquitin-protein ligase TRIM39-like n=1 Tax=Sphaeramia orbicularis TaxID=375764 RepID=A0A672ZGZ5_9TELE|nr:E3 ubiquitin-protein ligase TRIM39-like [Sphaeramia orbicularis]